MFKEQRWRNGLVRQTKGNWNKAKVGLFWSKAFRIFSNFKDRPLELKGIKRSLEWWDFQQWFLIFKLDNIFNKFSDNVVVSIWNAQSLQINKKCTLVVFSLIGLSTACNIVYCNKIKMDAITYFLCSLFNYRVKSNFQLLFSSYRRLICIPN